MSATLHQAVHDGFRAAFGRAPTLMVRAPGRVNLIGEHTDYNDGFVLPCAIDVEAVVAIAARSDHQVRVHALGHQPAHDHFELQGGVAHHPQGGWPEYVRAVVDVLCRDGHPLTGADLLVGGNVPEGAGLSSSAALQVALVHAFDQLLGLGLDKTLHARLAQRAENDFVGCRCGIMDQFVSAHGQAGHALLIDCRSLTHQAVEIPATLRLMVVHSRVSRGLVDSEYNQRRQQCEAAARHLGVAALRDLDLATLQQRGGGLEALTRRRAQHVVSENQRTVAAAQLLAAGPSPSLGAQVGRLLAQSHASLRDDFAVSTPAVDRLVDVIQQAVGDTGGARMTGGGFGGCVVALMPPERVETVAEAIRRDYQSPSGQPALVWTFSARPGVSRL